VFENKDEQKTDKGEGEGIQPALKADAPEEHPAEDVLKTGGTGG